MGTNDVIRGTNCLTGRGDLFLYSPATMGGGGLRGAHGNKDIDSGRLSSWKRTSMWLCDCVYKKCVIVVCCN